MYIHVDQLNKQKHFCDKLRVIEPNIFVLGLPMMYAYKLNAMFLVGYSCFIIAITVIVQNEVVRH